MTLRENLEQWIAAENKYTASIYSSLRITKSARAQLLADLRAALASWPDDAEAVREQTARECAEIAEKRGGEFVYVQAAAAGRLIAKDIRAKFPGAWDAGGKGKA